VAGSMSGVNLKRRVENDDLDMTIFPGTTLSFDLVLYNGGQAEDLTGWSIALTATANNGTTVLDLSTGNGKATVLPIGGGRADALVNGRVRFEEAAEVTAKARNGTWKVMAVTPDGKVSQIVSGRVGGGT
jgi:hypothetical protein